MKKTWQIWKSFWQKSTAEGLGVAWNRDEGLFFAVWRKDGRQHKISEFGRILPIKNAPHGGFEEAVEKFSLVCRKQGFEQLPVYFCADKNQLYRGEKNFPGMTAKEMASAVYWELVAQCPYGEGNYFYDLQTVNHEVCVFAAMEKKQNEEIQRIFRQNQLALRMILYPSRPEGEEAVLFSFDEDIGEEFLRFSQAESGQRALAALGFASGQRTAWQFFPDSLKTDRWHWRRLSAGIFLAGLVGMGICWGSDRYRLYALHQEAARQKEQMAAMQDVFQRQAAFEGLMTNNHLKDQQLLAISQRRISWYGILLHLGERTVEGAWLTDVNIEQGKRLQVKGRAVHYEAIPQLVAKLSAPEGKFFSSATVQGTEVDQKGQLIFSLQLALE